MFILRALCKQGPFHAAKVVTISEICNSLRLFSCFCLRLLLSCGCTVMNSKSRTITALSGGKLIFNSIQPIYPTQSRKVAKFYIGVR